MLDEPARDQAGPDFAGLDGAAAVELLARHAAAMIDSAAGADLSAALRAVIRDELPPLLRAIIRDELAHRAEVRPLLPGDRERFELLVQHAYPLLLDRVWPAASLAELAHASDSDSFALAVADLSIRALGKCLARLRGHVVDGVTVVQVAGANKDRSGALWQFERVSNPHETRKPEAPIASPVAPC